MEKDKWGGKGSKVDPLIVNTAQVTQNLVPSSSHVGGQQVQFQPSVTPFPPNRTTTAPYAASTSSALSSYAPPFTPAARTQFSDRGRERRSCAACRGPHAFFACHQFLDMESAARRPFTARHRVCFKCANSTAHGWRQCTQQHLKCFWCQSANHHSTLHVDQDDSPEPFTDAHLSGGPFMMGASNLNPVSTVSSNSTSAATNLSASS